MGLNEQKIKLIYSKNSNKKDSQKLNKQIKLIYRIAKDFNVYYLVRYYLNDLCSNNFFIEETKLNCIFYNLKKTDGSHKQCHLFDAINNYTDMQFGLVDYLYNYLLEICNYKYYNFYQDDARAFSYKDKADAFIGCLIRNGEFEKYKNILQ